MIDFTNKRPHRDDADGWYELVGYLVNSFSVSLGTFGSHGIIAASGLDMVAENALIIKSAFDDLDSYIEQCTGVVCPGCVAPCCISRFGYYDFDDLVYILATGYDAEKDEYGILHFQYDSKDPCGFLDDRGCKIQRSLRPFRCNWFFCSPLMEFMECAGMKKYRFLTSEFQRIMGLRSHISSVVRALL